MSKTIRNLSKTNKKKKPLTLKKDQQLEEESEESDSYITEIRRRPKKHKKLIIYENEIDSLPNYEPSSPSEEEQDNNEIEIKPKR